MHAHTHIDTIKSLTFSLVYIKRESPDNLGNYKTYIYCKI